LQQRVENERFFLARRREPGAGEPSGWVSCALGAGVTAGPGGNSSGPARPQPARPSAAVSPAARAAF
jgi:hypothetical protein